MESHLSGNPNEEQVVISEDNRDISPSRKQQKTKQKRKVSTVSSKDNDKTNKRASKRQPPTVRTMQETSEAPEFTTTCNSKSADGDHLSELEKLQPQLEDKDQKAALSLMQLTLDERNTTSSLQKNEVTTSQKDDQTNDGINVTNGATAKEEPTSTKETEQINADLEKKLAQEDELDLAGTIDLSSMNVNDSDITFIIQQAFRTQKKKCTRLVLRDNALTANGVKLLVDELLKTPTSLRNLTLSNNPGIGDAGMEHLVRLLQTNRSITLLALHRTGITDRSVRLLADLLCAADDNHFPSLEKLYVSWNKSITDASLVALVQILEQNKTLKVLSLENCSLSDKARRLLRQVVTKKKKKKFNLSE